jgi:hypothetical protein
MYVKIFITCWNYILPGKPEEEHLKCSFYLEGGLSAKRILFISKKKFHNSQKVNAFPYFNFFYKVMLVFIT